MTLDEIVKMPPSPAGSDTLGWRRIDADTERGWIEIGFEGRLVSCLRRTRHRMAHLARPTIPSTSRRLEPPKGPGQASVGRHSAPGLRQRRVASVRQDCVVARGLSRECKEPIDLSKCRPERFDGAPTCRPSR